MLYKKKLKNDSKSNKKQSNKEMDSMKPKQYMLFMYHFYINYIYSPFKIFVGIAGIYFVWILLHYFASHLYVKLCVPNTLYGFFISPFIIATPYCVGLRWLIITGANTINNMWILLGTWICANMNILKPVIL